ncbi:unnamed protein product [Cuscuta epithymum]|uniref:RING-type E3 ubiquitin transferase n=1 Tax=Cuscuta epithymum TaxID=186058 RepID=A0AAV0GJA6_9ASTE|nr:unnamed protein product [Cuscuta epithymum]
MASPATTSASFTANAAATHFQTHWCHECDMSVLLCPSTSSPVVRCPHCSSDILEQMDSLDPSPLPNLGSIPSLAPLLVDHSTALIPSDDNFLLDSPSLNRLIHRMATTNDAFTSTNRHHNPTSKSALQSLKVIQIGASILEKDPILACPICKEEFLLNLEVKLLPCKHMYHSDCILPWLEINNSCPVCRFLLPSREDEDFEVDNFPRGDNFIGSMRLEELMNDDAEEFFRFQSTIRRILHVNEVSTMSGGRDEAIIHIERMPHAIMEGDGASEICLLSPTQIGGADLEVGVARGAASLETVSSFPCSPGDDAYEGEVDFSSSTSSRLDEGVAVLRS